MSAAQALRLVTGGPERRAIEAGEVDAVIHSTTGNVFLLPQAKRALTAASSEAANSVLATLPRQDYQRLLGQLELVPLAYGQVLYEPGERIRHVYFPNDAIVALLVMVEDKALQVGLVGSEGMVGIPLVLGSELATVRAMIHATGSALRMKAADFREELQRCVPLQRELHRWACVKLVQARQTAACNRFHQVKQRLACWLLMTRDRTGTDSFHLTHQFLADILGVRRVGVTNAATTLQRGKLIRYHRGDITILERKGLEAAACSCYKILANLAR
jgi:CRP-like cAMP-binding protein